ncbi:MAG: hypothetical protein M5U05_06325 [Anaerolineales bacterium]|nr:hypothetical protein [Anaerolineales bacterium]
MSDGAGSASDGSLLGGWRNQVGFRLALRAGETAAQACQDRGLGLG